jgi:hypothetical protein
MRALSSMKPEELDKILNPENLDTKRAITLSKYIYRGFELLVQKDTCK